MKNILNRYNAIGQKLSAFVKANSGVIAQVGLFVFGVALVTLGVVNGAFAQEALDVNQDKLQTAIETVFIYLEGSFGALLMVAAGLGAIMSSAFGQYKAALSLLVVAVGTFILRSFVATWFGEDYTGTGF